MADIETVAAALAVIVRYETAGGKSPVAAGHDAVYAGTADSHPDAMTDADRRAMHRRGWHWDDEVESWAVFV